MKENMQQTEFDAGDTFTLFCHDLPTKPREDVGTVLVSGASGYIGGRLVPELIARGYKVRVMVRAETTVMKKRFPKAEVVVGDALDRKSLERALKGVHTAYYLIHSLLLGPRGFEDADIEAARNFRQAAEKNGVERMLYLGGLGDCRTSQSRHLQCRMEVADELAAGSVPVTILRAAVIIGSGSASYEIIRHLAGRLPFLLIPPWARNRCQPIGVRDVIKYLVGCLEVPETSGRSFDIGGRDILTYELMLETFADVIGKKVAFFHVPSLDIRIFAYAASLLTPVPAPITLCLMEGLKDEVVARDDEITKLIPFEPLSYREAIARALTREEQDKVHTRWSDAYPPAHELAIKLYEMEGKPLYTARYDLESDKGPERLFSSISRIGGRQGWFNSNWMWWLRGMVDRVFFGVGSTRGRRSQTELEVNDVIDFWRVEEIRENERLLLRAEMKLPGKAWLEFGISEDGSSTTMTIRPWFYTKTVFGKAYWYAFLPFHQYIFQDLLKQIEKRA